MSRDEATITQLIGAVSDLRDDALRMERRFARDIALVHPSYRRSARNLLHYLALRQRDIRTMQTQLANWDCRRSAAAKPTRSPD